MRGDIGTELNGQYSELPPKDGEGQGFWGVEKQCLPVLLCSKVNYKVYVIILASGCYSNMWN